MREMKAGKRMETCFVDSDKFGVNKKRGSIKWESSGWHYVVELALWLSCLCLLVQSPYDRLLVVATVFLLLLLFEHDCIYALKLLFQTKIFLKINYNHTSIQTQHALNCVDDEWESS